jgi:MFS transporter, DHA2 family, multidrug resistance protein
VFARKHAVGLAGFSITATFAPAIGPAIGGYLNDTYRWPWVFLRQSRAPAR